MRHELLHPLGDRQGLAPSRFGSPHLQSDHVEKDHVAQVVAVFLKTSNFGHLLENARSVLARGLTPLVTNM